MWNYSQSRLWKAWFLLGFATLLLPPLAAQDETKPGETYQAQGQVVTVSLTDKQFVLRTDKDQDLVLSINESSRFNVNGKDATWADIRKGLDVRVLYQKKGDRNVLLSLAETAASKPAGDDQQQPAPAPITVVGTVDKVRDDLKSLALKLPNDKEVVLYTDDRIRWEFRNGARRLSDLSAGAQVKVVYILENGKNMIVSITDDLQPAKSAADQATSGASSSGASPRTSAKNAIVGHIVRIKRDLIIVRTVEGDVAILMSPDSKEPIVVDQGTAVKVANRDGKLGDLREGEEVNVLYDAKNGRNYATLIKVEEGPITPANQPLTPGTKNPLPGGPNALPPGGGDVLGPVGGTGVGGVPGGGVLGGDGSGLFGGQPVGGLPFFPGFFGGDGSSFGGFSQFGGNVQVAQGTVTAYQGNMVQFQTSDGQTLSLQNFQPGQFAGVTFDQTSNNIVMIAVNTGPNVGAPAGTGAGTGQPTGAGAGASGVGAGQATGPGTGGAAPGGGAPPRQQQPSGGRSNPATPAGSPQSGAAVNEGAQVPNASNQPNLQVNNLRSAQGQLLTVVGRAVTLQVSGVNTVPGSNRSTGASASPNRAGVSPAASGLQSSNTAPQLSLNLPAEGSQATIVFINQGGQPALVAMTTLGLNQQSLQQFFPQGTQFLQGQIGGFQGGNMILRTQNGQNVPIALFAPGTTVTATVQTGTNFILNIAASGLLGTNGLGGAGTGSTTNTGNTGTGGSGVVPFNPQSGSAQPGSAPKAPSGQPGSAPKAPGGRSAGPVPPGVPPPPNGEISPPPGVPPNANGNPAGGTTSSGSGGAGQNTAFMTITGQVVSEQGGVIVIAVNTPVPPGVFGQGNQAQPGTAGQAQSRQPAQAQLPAGGPRRESFKLPPVGTAVSVVVQSNNNNQNTLLMLSAGNVPLPIFPPALQQGLGAQGGSQQQPAPRGPARQQ